MATVTRTFTITTGVGPAGADGTSEGTDILSTGETGGVKFLREDGDGTSSWQAVSGAGLGDALTTDPLSQFAATTLSQLNVVVSDATLIDTGDSRLSDDRDPTAHTHTLSEVTDSGTAAALDVGTGANEVVQLNASSELPAVSGANLTNLPSGATELSGLSDVNTSTPTDRNVLVADGVDFESRPLVEADISDLGTYSTATGVENNADVTDTANVTAAGAVMDSELTSEADVKALDQSVISGAAPTFLGTNITGTALDLIAGSSHKLVKVVKVSEAAGVSKGDLLYISGASGANTLVSLADKADFTKVDVLAIANEDGDNNDFIEVIGFGEITDIDTSAISEGGIVYLGSAGAFTADHATGIDAVVRAGRVTRSHASQGSLLFTPDSHTIVDDFNGTVRHQIVNPSDGTSAAASYTVVNDAEHRASLTITGSGFTGAAEHVSLLNQGYGQTSYYIDGNEDHVWFTDVTDAHAFAATEKMRLTAAGELETLCQIIDHTATAADDHALEIDCNAAGFGDVKAIDVDYITGAITTGQDEAVILVNIDESAATGGSVAALEVLATEGDANIHGMVVGVGVNPIGQLSGVFEDMDSALVNATDRLTEFTTAGSDIQMFVADDDTVTIGSAAKFEEIEFLLAIGASGAGISPTFEFSTGSGTWTAFTPVDGTNSMRNSGVIAWVDGDIPSWAVGVGIEYLIRITRTQNGLSTPPTESKVQIAAAIEHGWDKDANLIVNDINAADVTATGTISGTLAPADVKTAIPATGGYLALQTLTDATTIAYDADDGVQAKVTITADRTLGAISNTTAGMSGTLTIIQDGTGGWALTLDANQTDMLGTLADITALGAGGIAKIAWETHDGTNFYLWITAEP